MYELILIIWLVLFDDYDHFKFSKNISSSVDWSLELENWLDGLEVECVMERAELVVWEY